MQFKDLKVGDYFTILIHDNVNDEIGLMVVAPAADPNHGLIGSTLKDGSMIYGLEHEEVILMNVTIEAEPKGLRFRDLTNGEKFRKIIFNSNRSVVLMKLNRANNGSSRYTALEGDLAGTVHNADCLDDIVERVVE